MECPSCHQLASSVFRTAFSLQGVTFSKAMKGYFKCRHCGAMLQIINGNLTIMLQILAGLVSVAVYVILFRFMNSLVGYKIAVGLFFPFLFFIGLSFAAFLVGVFAKVASVDEKK